MTGRFAAAISAAAVLSCFGMAVQVRAEAGQAGDDLLLGGVLGPRLLLERVLRDVDVDGAGSPGPGDVERLGDDARDVVGVAHEVVVLGHRQGDAVDVDLLEGVLAQQGRHHVAGDRDHRHGVQERGPDPGDEVRGARAGRPHAHADAAGHPGVPVGGVGATLLVADQDVAQLRVVAQDVVEREDHAARVAEEDIDALAQHRLAQDVRPDARPLEVTRLVEHPLAGLLDGRGLGRTVVRHVTASRGPRSSVPLAVPRGVAGSSLAMVICVEPPGCRPRLGPEYKRPSPPGEGPFGLRWFECD